MCGIAGCVSYEGPPVPRERLAAMIGAVSHRGPDGIGLHVDGPVGLAHARLSIIDVAGGRQPLSNEDGRVWVTFNGEIFNYLELRDELLHRGHRFATHSDTEVIVHAFEEWGEDCVHRFNGQWAFAIWDAARERLFLSRDRLGIRPLFFTNVGARFLFASEVKALFQDPEVGREFDPLGLEQIFTLWATLPPRTCFRHIQELPPAHSMIVEAGRATLRRDWQLDYTVDPQFEDEEVAAERLRELLIDATRLQLRSDVPVGAYLSGGLDSSLTTGLIRQFTGADLQTFSVTFDQAEFDETGFQQEVVRQWQTSHCDRRVSQDDIAAVLPDVVRHTEKPILRTAPAPLYLLARRVREAGCKVVISGEGADEVLGGYDLFKETAVRRFWGRQPESKHRPLLLKRLYPWLKTLQSQSPEYLKAFFRVRPEDLASPFFSHLPRWELTAGLKRFFSADLRSLIDDYDVLEDVRRSLPSTFDDWPSLCRAQHLETTQLLPGYILCSQGDRMAMAHGVEGRFPFLDHRVVEFAASLPPRHKLQGLCEKYLLKKVARGLVPESVRQRPKQPYRAPDLSAAFRGRSAERLRDAMSHERIAAAGLFDPNAVARLVRKAEAGQVVGERDSMALAGVLSTQLLHEQLVAPPARSDHEASPRISAGRALAPVPSVLEATL